MTNEEFTKKRNELLEQESNSPEMLWYLSFADEKFNGAVIIMAKGLMHAIMISHMLKINPGGQVLADYFRTPPELWPDRKWWNRILSKEELKQMDEEYLIKRNRVFV